MKTFRNILLIVLALLVQSSLSGKLDIYGVRPDFALLVLIFLTYESSPVSAILYGFFIGFFQDVYSPEYLGYNTFTMSLMAFFLGIVKERLTVEDYSVKLFSTLIICLVHDGLYLSLYTKFDLSILVPLFVRESLPGAVYTSVLAVLFLRAWEYVQSGGLAVVIQGLFSSKK